jgi:hypothetical protein
MILAFNHWFYLRTVHVGFAIFKKAWARLLGAKNILRLFQFSFPFTNKPDAPFSSVSAHLCNRSDEVTGYDDLCPNLLLTLHIARHGVGHFS